MTDIIEKWLLNCIGENVSVDPESLGEICQDGTLYAQILNKYNICSHEYTKMITETDKFEVAYSNLKKLCIWFKLLGIPYNDLFLTKIASKDGSTALRLLYEIFIRLENKENLKYVDWQKKESLLSESTDIFKVRKAIIERSVAELDCDKAYLEDSFRIGKEIIKVHQYKEKNLLEKRMEEIGKRKRAIKNLEEKMKPSAVEKGRARRCMDNVEFYKVVAEFEDRLKTSHAKNEVVDCSLDAYVSLLKVKRRENEMVEKSKENQERKTLEDAWKLMLMKKEEVARDILAKKLLKQSEYEKQIICRLKKCRLRHKKLIDNRKKLSDIEERYKFYNDFKEGFRVSDTDYWENKRLMQLHKKLFKRKQIKVYNFTYKECKKILFDIIDLAILYIEYEAKYKGDPPFVMVVEWKILFIKGLTLLDFPLGEKPSEGEVIVTDVQETLAGVDFHRYMNLLGPWNLPDVVGFERLDSIGYLVHRILDQRYTFNMASGTMINLPGHRVRVLLRQLNNLYVIEKLKDLLNMSRIAVVDINSAVSYVIDAYDKSVMESGSYKTIPPVILPKIGKPVTLNRQRKKSILMEKTLIKDISVDTRTRTRTVGVQFPEQESVESEEKLPGLDNAVQLGMAVTNVLANGLPLSDVLASRILLEYLKNLRDVQGWILVDFPQDLEQVAVLEYMLSGWEVPFAKNYDPNMSYAIKKGLEECGFQEDDNESRENGFPYNQSSPNDMSNTGLVSSEDYLKLQHPSLRDIVYWKRSEILPKPYSSDSMPFFKSFFTNVINIECNASSSLGCSLNLKQPPNLDEIDPENPKIDGTVEDFYRCLGILSTFTYRKFNPQTLMALTGFILNVPTNEGDPNWESAIDLYGFDILTQTKPKRHREQLDTACMFEDTLINCELLQGPKYIIPSLEGITKELHQKENIAFEALEEQNATENNEEPKTSVLGLKSSFSNKQIDYDEFLKIESPIPKEFCKPLASVWETVEFFYKFNLNEIFNLLRSLECQLLPYRNYIRKVAKQCVQLSDDRSSLVSNFQVMLNGISEYQRSVKLVKNELHCRAFELQCKLWKLADLKKLLSEQTLFLLVEEQWLERRINNFIKTYMIFFQTEIDRFVDSIQLIIDYASITLLGNQSAKRFSKITMPNFEWARPETAPSNESMRKTKSKTGGTSGSMKSTLVKKDTSQSKKNIFSSHLFDEHHSIYCEDILGQGITALLETVENLIDLLKIRIKNVKEQSKTALEDSWEAWFMKERNYNNSSRQILNFFENCLEDETDRVIFRVNLITKKAMDTIKEQISVVEGAFADFKQDVVQQFHVEISNIEKLHDLICAAIEEEVKIQPCMMLTGDSLNVDPCKRTFPCPSPPPPTLLEEDILGWRFTTAQLENFMKKMSFCAPRGLKKTSLTAILQDMALIGHELGHPYLPPGWSSLTDKVIAEHVDRWFGDAPFVDWKLLLLFGLDLGYPTLKEIIEMKEEFSKRDPESSELLSQQGYMESVLWFEKTHVLSLSEELRRSNVKQILFKLMRIDKEHINYTVFLLSFARDEDPVAGFVKALAIVNGSLVVAHRVDLLLEEDQIKYENEKYEIIKWIIEELIFRVCKLHDVIITELFEPLDVWDLRADFLTITKGDKISHPEFFEEMMEDNKADKQSNAKSQTSIKSTNKIETRSFANPVKHSESPTSLETREINNSAIWKSDVHIDTILSILLFHLGFNTPSRDHQKEQIKIREKLQAIFNTKGDGHTMKFYILLEQDYIKNLLSSYRLFNAINITKCMSLTNKPLEEFCNEYNFK